MEPAGDEPALPPNWRSAKAADGKEYYFNELTGETSWTVPEGGDATKVPPLVSDIADRDTDAPPATVVAMGEDVDPSMPPDLNTAHGGLRSKLAILKESLPKLLIILGSSFVVMLQSSIEYSQRAAPTVYIPGVGEEAVSDFPASATAYAISVSVVSLVAVLVVLALAVKKPLLLESFQLKLPAQMGLLSIMQLLGLFLSTWWSIGTGILTFYAPYTSTSNAYFATWISLIASTQLLAASFGRVQSAWKTLSEATQADSDLQLNALLLISSVTLLLASLDDFGQSSFRKWGFSCGILSIALVLIQNFLKKTKRIGPPGEKGFSLLLLLFWIFAAGILTLDKPFKSTGNGFFACWTGLVTAASLFYKHTFGSQMRVMEGFRRSFSMSYTGTTDTQPMPEGPRV